MGRKTVLACVLAWLIPGGGHFFLRCRRRGLVFSAVILLLFTLGLRMNGQLFDLTFGFFDILKFFAGISTGLLYLAVKTAGLGAGKITTYGYEYGNTFLYTAGLLNMLVIVDAFDIAQGRKK